MSTGADERVLAKSSGSKVIFNVPNQLTTLRLILSLVLFVFLAFQWYQTSLVLFLIAAGTDWLDGYWARKYGQVTILGRIFDPFVDKVIVCGTFIFLAAEPLSGIRPWMVVLIVGRELLVTALRGFLEGEGADFSAAMSGKLKMVFQCAAAAMSMYALSSDATARPEWFAGLLQVAVGAAVVLTAYSGVAYITAAARLIRR